MPKWHAYLLCYTSVHFSQTNKNICKEKGGGGGGGGQQNKIKNTNEEM